jgi:hypothetical protein
MGEDLEAGATPSKPLAAMKHVVGYIAATIAAIFFGDSIALLDPYEHTYDFIIWAFSSLLFGVIFWRMSAANRLAWILYGLATIACRLLAEFSFWNHIYKSLSEIILFFCKAFST